MLILGFFICTLASALIFPSQIHIAWTENPSEMRVTWVSVISSSPSVSFYSPTCNLQSSVTQIEAESFRFNLGDHSQRFKYINTAVIPNVQKNCTYAYSVTNGYFRSSYYEFKGITPWLNNSDPFSILVYGDLGIGSISYKTWTYVIDTFKSNEDLLGIFHLGDMGYNLEDFEGLVGDVFGEMIQEIAAKYPYMTVPGNHEKKNNFAHYKARYHMPSDAQYFENKSEIDNTYYSINLGLIHFVFINTNYIHFNSTEKGQMISWLKSDLTTANNNRNSQPWIITLSHHPLYCSNDNTVISVKDCVEDTSIIREDLEEIYYENKVDLVLQGHTHRYERNGPIYQSHKVKSEVDQDNMHINPNAPVYIISGNAGTTIGNRDPLILEPAEWEIFQSYEYGFGKLTCFNQTHLLWEQFSSEHQLRVDFLYLVKYSS